MNIQLEGVQIELTPSISAYVDKKLGGLAKLVRSFDKEGTAQLSVEVGRTTRHHHKGEVFRAEANLKLAGKLLRAEDQNTDLLAAIDRVEDKLRGEILKYKTKLEVKRKSVRDKS